MHKHILKRRGAADLRVEAYNRHVVLDRRAFELRHLQGQILPHRPISAPPRSLDLLALGWARQRRFGQLSLPHLPLRPAPSRADGAGTAPLRCDWKKAKSCCVEGTDATSLWPVSTIFPDMILTGPLKPCGASEAGRAAMRRSAPPPPLRQVRCEWDRPAGQ